MLSDKVDVKGVSLSNEISGTVCELGSEVTHLKIGDRVLAMTPCYFATQEVVPESCCIPLADTETFTVWSRS